MVSSPVNLQILIFGPFVFHDHGIHYIVADRYSFFIKITQIGKSDNFFRRMIFLSNQLNFTTDLIHSDTIKMSLIFSEMGIG